MRVVVAPNAFKGCLTARQAAEAIARGVKAGGHEPVLAPVADGGDGTLDALVAGVGGRVMGTIARGPLGLPVRAHLGILSDGTGVVEMAQASGLTLVPAGDRDPMRATSYGTGELMRAALSRRPGRIIMALGGSATVDGGTGIARALGLKFLDADDKPLPDGGGPLERLVRIDNTKLDPRVTATPIVIASDVTNPLLGPDGAARVFGPQKGATPDQVEALERGLATLAGRLKADIGADVAGRPGAGAAGGTGAMLMALGASLRPGVEVVLEALRFNDLLNNADLVITGEGKLDRQTLGGKAPVGVANAAAGAGVPCAAIVGSSEIEAGEAGLAAVRSLVDHFGDPAAAMAKAEAGLATLAAAVVRSFASARMRR